MIWPEAPEIKDRYWTLGRSVLCPWGSAAAPGTGKHLVLDGRLRSAMPDPAGSVEDREKKSASLFFLVARWKPPDPAEAPPDFVNLAMCRVAPTSSLALVQVAGPKLRKDCGETAAEVRARPDLRRSFWF